MSGPASWTTGPQEPEGGSHEKEALDDDRSRGGAALRVAGIRASNCATPSNPRSTPIPKSGRRFTTSVATQEERVQGAGPVVSARLGRRLGRRSQPAQPDPPRHRHCRQDAVADRRRPHRRPAAVRQRRPRGRNPPPGVAHRRRRGAGRGALRIRRAQRRRAPTSTICCSSGWWRSRRTMRRSMSGLPATFAKASPRARSASPTSSRPKSGCSRPAPA